jgi:AraC-like DNA-binding protein
MSANNKSSKKIISNHQMRIEVRLPNGHWAGDVSRSHPSSLLRIDEHMALTKGQGTGIISSTEDLSMTLIAHQGVADFEVVESNRYHVTINAGGGGFLKPLLELQVIPKTPFTIRDGWVDWIIECDRDKMRGLIERFKEENIPYRLVSTRSSSSRLLTERQRQVYDIALREGFYDPQRKITLTALAELLGVSKSTLSAQLQRVESTVMHFFSEEIRRRSP